MIILVASIYDFRGPVVDWAMKKITNIKSKIPQDIQEKIASYIKGLKEWGWF